jgi:hypothetical protein
MRLVLEHSIFLKSHSTFLDNFTNSPFFRSDERLLLKEEKPWLSPLAKSPELFQHKQEKLEEISNSR